MIVAKLRESEAGTGGNEDGKKALPRDIRREMASGYQVPLKRHLRRRLSVETKCMGQLHLECSVEFVGEEFREAHWNAHPARVGGDYVQASSRGTRLAGL